MLPHRRPGEGQDPYRVIDRLRVVPIPNDQSSPNCSLGLWVLAFARTTAAPLPLLPHPIPRRRMRRTQPRTPVTEQLLPQRALRVLRLVPPTPRQLRHQHVGDVLEIAG